VENEECVQTVKACLGGHGSIIRLPSLTWLEDTVSIVISPSNDLCREATEQPMVIQYLTSCDHMCDFSFVAVSNH